MDARLYSPNPIERLTAASKLSHDQKAEILRPFNPWVAGAYGAANAWVVIVGPSPGMGGKRSAGDPLKKRQPVLGEVHFKFRDPNTLDKPFLHNLFGALESAFRRAGFLGQDQKAHLKLLHTLNLDSDPAGEEADISQSKLQAGLNGFFQVLRRTRPRLVIALTKRVAETILDGLRRTNPGSISEGDRYGIKGGGKRYERQSYDIRLERYDPFLLVSLPQHPSRANTIPDYDEKVGGFIAHFINGVIHE